MADAAPLLELQGITKRFGPLVANRSVDLRGFGGEVLGLVGENGAGKSTSMAIASGLYRPDAGAIIVDGEPCLFRSPLDAMAAGIDMVHQHFMLVETATVAENVVLGVRGGQWLKRRRVEREVEQLAERYGMPIDPRAPIHGLSPPQQQTVEILTALYRQSRILILDEPTSLLGPAEVAALFAIVRRIAAEGRLVILISHKLDEVLAVCDRVSVMRRGEVVTTLPRAQADRRRLAEEMVGHGVEEPRWLPASRPGPAALRIAKLEVDPEVHGSGLHGVDLTVRAGEVVGVVGVAGNGQRELAEAILGLRQVTRGGIELCGRPIEGLSTRERFELGLACVDEDPRRTALLLQQSVGWNVGMRFYRSAGRRLTVDYGALRERTERLIAQYDVRGARPETPIGRLSGGNQQKVLLARELELAPKLLVAVNPTVGLDIGAATAVHASLVEQRDRGAAILLISTDLDEAAALSDRVAVMYRGRVAGQLGRGPDRKEVGRLMAGVGVDEEVGLAGVA